MNTRKISQSLKTIRFTAVALVAVLSYTLTACGGEGGGSGGTHIPETVVYSSSDSNGTIQLNAVDDDGLNRRRLSGNNVRIGADIKQFSVSPDGQWVGYLSDTTVIGIDALYVVPIDGSTAPQQVSRVVSRGTNRSVKNFNWSPNSTQITYTANLDGGISASANMLFANEVFLINRDGSNEVKINGPIRTTAEVRNPQWSPDGRYILQEVASYNSGSADRLAYAVNIYDVTAGAPNSTRLVTAIGSVRDIRWSPDSTRFSYRADLTTQNIFHVHVTTVSGATTTWTEVDGFNGETRWAPDGLELAYADPPELLVGEQATSTKTILSTNVDQHNHFEWSPLGLRMAYLADRDSDSRSDLFVVNTNGSNNAPVKINAQGVTDGFSRKRIAWSPDGNRIAYLVYPHLYVGNADGSGSQQVTLNHLARDEFVADFTWSANGLRLAYSTELSNSSGSNNLYTSSINGANRVHLNETDSVRPVNFEFLP